MVTALQGMPKRHAVFGGVAVQATATRPAGVGFAPVRRLHTLTGLRLSALLIAACVGAVGLTTVLATVAQEGATHHARATAEPLGVMAEGIYRDLSDADAASAQVFLAGARAGTADQQRYDTDIQHVSSELARVAADTGSSPALRSAIAEIVADLPTYTRLVGVAHADGRQNLPIGAAYLREASGLLRSRLLPAAQRAQAAEKRRLGEDNVEATADPLVEIGLMVAALAGLGAVQVFVFRRTNRIVNPGIAAATLLVVVLALWAGVVLPAEHGDLAGARRHRLAADAVVSVDLAVIRAHGDEVLGLAARGEDLGGYERDYVATIAAVPRMLAAGRGPQVADARSALARWQAAHLALVGLETDPHADNSANGQALALVTQTGAGGPGGAFARIDADLRQAVARQESAYLSAVGAGRGDLSGLAPGAGVLAVVALVCGGWGIGRRLREFG
jgi:hypothetical protein